MERESQGFGMVFVKSTESDLLPWVSLPEAPEKRQVVESHWTEAKRKVMEALPSNAERLDTDRIDAFIEDLGLSVGDYIFVDQSKAQEVAAILGKVGVTNVAFDDTFGRYFPEIDLAIIIRDPDSERVNGAGFSESMAVHELIHASSAHRTLRVVETPKGGLATDTPRIGYSITPNPDARRLGEYIEEGVAEVLRAKYVSQVLGKPNGFANTPTNGVLTQPDGLEISIPGVYLYFNSTGELTTSKSSLAAVGMESLIQYDPQLLSAALKAGMTWMAFERWHNA